MSVLQNPENVKYTALKEQLLSIFILFHAVNAAKYFNMPDWEDRKPSEYRDLTLALLKNHQPCFPFDHLLLHHMPDDIRHHLASQDTEYRQLLARHSDALRHARPTGSSIFLGDLNFR